MKDTVEAYAGYTAAERPRVVVWQGERIEVAEVLSRARLPGGHWFKVRARGGEVFGLTYTSATGEWDIQIQAT
jgi:hypothetical protein